MSKNSCLFFIFLSIQVTFLAQDVVKIVELEGVVIQAVQDDFDTEDFI